MSNKEQNRLGRGLGALLGEKSEVDSLRKPVGYVNKEIAGAKPRQDTSDVLRIPVNMVEPNPWQPRSTFDKTALEELAASIRSLGLIQPISVRKLSEGHYQIISGERRFNACQMAGMTMIPAYVRDATDQGMLEMAIVENIQRENLDPIELAMSYQRLIDECALTQEQMALRIGKKRASITNAIRLLKLPAKVQHDLKVGLLSVGHAKVILGVDDPASQEMLCDMVVKDGLSVRDLEREVRKLLSSGRRSAGVRREQELPEDYTRVLSHIGKYFANDISLKRSSSGRGTMTVRFESDEEVSNFLKALEQAGL